MSYLDNLSTAWDSQAERYDTGFRGRPVTRYIHKREMASLEKAFKPGMHLLEIGCGTGEEAIALAKKGIRVTAIDVSPAMIAFSIRKAVKEQVESLIDFKVIPAEEINLLKDKQFDGAYSLLGPVNCVKEMKEFAGKLKAMVKPKGSLVFSVINKYCPWESFYYGLKGDLSTAFRRLKRPPVKVKLAQEVPAIDLWYYTPRSFYEYFKDSFELNEIVALPLIMPPRSLEKWYNLSGRPGLPEHFEKIFSGIYPFNRLGDHFLITMNKRS